VKQTLASELQPADSLVLGNLRSYKVTGIAGAFQADIIQLRSLARCSGNH